MHIRAARSHTFVNHESTGWAPDTTPPEHQGHHCGHSSNNPTGKSALGCKNDPDRTTPVTRHEAGCQYLNTNPHARAEASSWTVN